MHGRDNYNALAKDSLAQEVSDVYNRLQEANKIIAELVQQLQRLEPGKPWPSLTEFMDKSNILTAKYGDINDD